MIWETTALHYHILCNANYVVWWFSLNSKRFITLYIDFENSHFFYGLFDDV